MSSQLILDPENLSEARPKTLTLVDLLRGRAQSQPARLAYTFLLDGEQQELSLTYGELDRQARAIAAWLQPLVSPNDRVLLLYPPGLEYIAAFFGCLYAGAVAVPAYPPRRNRNLLRLQALVADAQASVALTTAPVLARISPLFSQNPYLEPLRWLTSDNISAGIEHHWQPPAINSEALAFLQYTSGSTSAPRGVMLTHGNLLHNEQIIQHAFQQSAESVILGWLPLYHDMGLIGNVIQPLYVGAPCILMSPAAFLQKPWRWLEAISRHRVTTSGGPNFAYDLCARKISEEQRATLDLSSWTVAFNGSEPIRWETMERFAKTFEACGFKREAFSSCYGLAEATLIVTGGSDSKLPVVKTVDARALENNLVVEVAADMSEAAETKTMVGCGAALLGQQLVIVDRESSVICPPDRVGEIWLAGPSVAAGYWNRPEETEHTFQARLAESGAGPFLRTGDLGFLQDGELYVTGRLKDLIIIRGLNHYPQDIELTAEQCSPLLRPGCGAAFAVEVDGEEKLVLVQEADHRRQANLAEVIEQIIEAIAQGHEMQVHAVSLIRSGSIPKTSSGKIQRHACRAAFLERSLKVLAEWQSESEAVGESVETAAGASWDTTEGMTGWLKTALAAKLRRNPAGIDVNQPVARYGLDSLLALELVHQVETDLGIVLPLTFFLQNLSITELAALMLDQQLTASVARSKLELSHEAVAVHPLSHGQKALWFLHQIAPASAAYNIVRAVRIRSELDAAALKRAFQALVDRHPSLRTTFIASDGEPVRSIHEKAEIFFAEEDATEWSEQSLRAQLSARAHLPFDLQQGPLLRVSLFRLAHGHVLQLAVHHIVSDLWSLAVLIREVGILYSAEHAGRPVTFAALPLQFSDIVRWEEQLLQGPEGERHWSYWQKQLAGDLPVLNLPVDHLRPSVQTYRGASVPFRLDAELTRRLKALGQENGATLYMTLLAAFQTLLARYTAQTDILVGSSTANRNWLEMAGIVGYFVNPVVLRGDLSEDPSFGAFLRQIRRVVLEAFEHQAYPLPLLVERLQPVRDPGYSPLFQVLFVLQNAHLGNEEALASLALGEAGVRFKLGELEVESLALEQHVAQFDMTMMLAESEGGLAASLQYNTDLFEPATIARMIGHFQRLLAGIVADPTQRLSQLPLLTDDERRLVLFDWNQSATPYAAHLSLNQLFEEQARRSPQAVALSFADTNLSYAELDVRANRLAHYLQRLGVSPETRVGVCLDRSVELVVALLAILKAGGAYVPLDPSYPNERLAFMLHDADCAVLLTSQTLAAALPEHQSKVVRLDADWPAITAESAAQPQSGVVPHNAAYVIYTSGSTGQPKGAINTHRGICNRLLWMQDAYNLTGADSVLQKTPFSFDVSVWEFFWPLMTGARLVLAAPDGHKDAAYLVRLIQAERITVLHFVPAMLQVFLEEPKVEHCTSLRLVISSGEALSVEHQERFFARLPAALHNLYGPTEAAVDVTYWACERESQKAGERAGVPIGRPIANLEIYLLDQHQQAVPVGVAGELHIGGVGLARGYLNRPALTAEKFIPHPFSSAAGERLYRTGDLARHRPGGEIEYLGRLDHQVKLRGLRIELGELEAVLSGHESVREAIVIVREDGAGGEKQLVAYVVNSGISGTTSGELQSYLRERMPEYMVPAAYVLLEEFPLMANGKVDRRALPKPERTPGDERQSLARAKTEVEELLCGMWSAVLRIEQVGIADNFFELGGHSLLATQLLSRIREAFEIDLELSTLFEFPTVVGLAAKIESAMFDEQGSRFLRLTPIGRDRDLPLSFAQQRLWFLDQLEPDSSFYNSPAALRLSGPLDITAFRRTFSEIIRRHEVLRTSFSVRDGQPVQHIHQPAEFPVPVRDLSHLTGEEREAEAMRLTRAEARRPFDLSCGPLMRATLLGLGAEEHILLLTMHHIVSDGWSVGILIREVEALYEAFTQGAESPLPELAIQYADYAAWQREWLTGDVLSSQLAYWRTQLSGPLPVLALPTDYPRPTIQSYLGASLATRLSPELSAAVKELSRAHHSTLYMTLLAAFAALLHRETGAEEVLVGTAVANRNRGETEGLIGFFVNMLVMRGDVRRQPSFAELLRRVRQVALGAYAHQDVPFEKLVEEFGGERNASQTPLFQVAFGVNNTPQEEIRIGALETNLLLIENETGRYDLTLWVEEGEAGLKATWYYNTDLFGEERIRRLAGRYEKLIESAAADPEARVSALDILTDEEKQQQMMEEQGLLESNVKMLKTARRKSPISAG